MTSKQTDPNKAASTDPEEPEMDTDWENRILCADGNCIGVIGPDGRCKECGKKYEPSSTAPSEPVEPESADSEAEDIQEEVSQDDEWENRRLCSDGNCIGVIGPDGRCKECGKPYEE